MYRPPKVLTGFSARMQFRASPSAADVLLELTTVSGIILGGVEGTIDMVMTDVHTTSFPKNYWVWNI